MNMKIYIKDGKIRKASQIVVIKDGMGTGNPTEEMILEDGWVEYEYRTHETPDDVKLDNAKTEMKKRIIEYDQSDDVNGCSIIYGGQKMQYWADKLTRSSLCTSINDYLKSGKKEYRLDIRDLSVSLNIPCEDLLNMLTSLEVYAVECYNATTDHLYAVDKLETLEDVESYNYKKRYPHKLTFEL